MHKKMSKVPCLFWAISFMFIWVVCSFSVKAAEDSITVKLEGQTDGIHIYATGNQEITVDGNTFKVAPGTYKYVCGNGAEGYLSVGGNTEKIVLSLVDFSKVKPTLQGVSDPGNIKVYENKGETNERLFSPASSNKWKFVLPRQDGDNYYTFVFSPYDT